MVLLDGAVDREGQLPRLLCGDHGTRIAPVATSLGREFAEALAAKDFGRIEGILDPEVDFRGLTPGRDWAATSASGLVGEILPMWFEEKDHIDELLSLEEGEPIGDRERVAYRFRGHDDEGAYIVEQQAYFTEQDGRITWMRVLCSGFQPS